MGGRGSSSSCPPAIAVDAAARVRDRCFNFGGPPSDCPPEGAFHELLGASRVYGNDRCDILPYVKENVSWPAPGSKAVPLLDFLAPADRHGLLAWDRHMLNDAASVLDAKEKLGIDRFYCDPSLFRPPRRYGEFIRGLARRGMVGFTFGVYQPIGYMDIFLVRKKDGSLRIVFDTRLLNCAFRSAPSTELATGAASSRLEFTNGGDGFIASADVSSCFYAMDVPDALARIFCLPPVYAEHAGFVELMSKATRRELWQVRSLLPLLSSDLRRSWSSTLYASDASPFGIGVCQRPLDVIEVCQVGAVAEKWRYAIAGAVAATQHALGVTDDADMDLLVSDAEPFLAAEGRDLAEVPASWLRPEDFGQLFGGFRRRATSLMGRHVAVWLGLVAFAVVTMKLTQLGERRHRCGLHLPFNRRLVSILLVLLVLPCAAAAPRKRPAAALLAHSEPRTARQEKEAGRRSSLLTTPSAATTALSFLEGAAVRTPCQADYLRRVQQFVAWCQLQRLDWETDAGLDSVLVLWADERFFKGDCSSEITKLLAALRHFLPQVSRKGQGTLPRVSRAIAAWRRLAPSSQRLPLPLAILCAMAAVAIANDQFEHALRWLIQFRAYLRPGECDRLAGCNLIPPRPAAGPQYCMWGLHLHRAEELVPGKTGVYDESILLDRDPWLGAILWQLKTSRTESQCLWQASPEEDIAVFNSIADRLQLQRLHPCRYSLRHGGASEDLLSQVRDVAAVKRRGRWRQDDSLRRYGKETKLLSELGKVPPATLQLGAQSMERLEEMYTTRQVPAFAFTI